MAINLKKPKKATDVFKEIIAGEKNKNLPVSDIKDTPVVNSGTAAPRKQPLIRRTPQGDVYDVNKPLVRSDFSNEESWRNAVNNKMIGGKGGKTVTGQNVTPAIVNQEQMDAQQAQLNKVLNEVPNFNQPPQITEQDILNAVPKNTLLEQGTAIGAGTTAGVGAGILAGAKAGSILGTAVSPGVGTAIGTVAGAVAGIGTYYVKIRASKRGDVKQAAKVAKTANTNFGQTIDALNAGLISHDVALKRWNEDKVALYAAQTNLKRDTDTNLDRFLSEGSDELVQVNDYIRDLETIYTNEFMLAYSQPNPQNIKYVNTNIEEEEEEE